MSVCTGAFYLAEAGLLDGALATTNQFYEQAFRERYPNVELVPEQRVVRSGRRFCAGGTTG